MQNVDSVYQISVQSVLDLHCPQKACCVVISKERVKMTENEQIFI